MTPKQKAVIVTDYIHLVEQAGSNALHHEREAARYRREQIRLWMALALAVKKQRT